MNDCKGCTSINICGNQEHGDYMIQGEIQRCPCKDCIVKMMCVEICDDLRQFRNVSFVHWNMIKTFVNLLNRT